MSIPLTTYEDMNEARSAYQKARSDFNAVYFNYLSTILEESGVRNKLVRLKDGTQGQFKVADDNAPYTSKPWAIKFFPCRKSDGLISTKTRFIPGFYSWEESRLVEQLKEICEVVGDLP